MDIMFARYGKEKKTRCEHYNVIAICPAFDQNVHKLDEIAGVAKELAIELKSGRLYRESCWKQVQKDFAGQNRAAVAVVVPASSHAVADMQELPFVHVQAWAESLIRNGNFILNVRKLYNIGLFNALGLQEGLLRWISDAHSSKKSKTGLLEWAAGDKTRRAEFIAALKKLDTVGHRRHLEKHLAYFKKQLEKKAYLGFRGYIKFESYLDILFQNFFEPNILERKEALIGKDKDSAVLMDTTVGMRKVRDVMLSLVPKK
jgi:hypothetical protein